MLNEFKYRIKQHVINEVVLGLPSLGLCVYSNMIVLMITPRGDRGRRRRRRYRNRIMPSFQREENVLYM